MYSIREPQAKKLDLPGRTVRVFIGTEKLSSDRMTIGMTEVPPESSMTAHTHEDMEEIIFVVDGHGEAIVGDSVEKLEPNTAVLFPLGVSHVVKNTSKEIMKFVFCFNPPNNFAKA